MDSCWCKNFDFSSNKAVFHWLHNILYSNGSRITSCATYVVRTGVLSIKKAPEKQFVLVGRCIGKGNECSDVTCCLSRFHNNMQTIFISSAALVCLIGLENDMAPQTTAPCRQMILDRNMNTLYTNSLLTLQKTYSYGMSVSKTCTLGWTHYYLLKRQFYKCNTLQKRWVCWEEKKKRKKDDPKLRKWKMKEMAGLCWEK